MHTKCRAGFATGEEKGKKRRAQKERKEQKENEGKGKEENGQGCNDIHHPGPIHNPFYINMASLKDLV